jgi:hypothetical protein
MSKVGVGIDQLKIVLIAVAKSANVVDGATNRGTTWLEKLAALMSLAPILATLPLVSFSAVAAEASDLDAVEKAELLQVFKDEFKIADQKLEQVFEGTVDIILDLDGIVKKSEALARTLKAA